MRAYAWHERYMHGGAHLDQVASTGHGEDGEAAASRAIASLTPAVEPLLYTAAAARIESPVRVGVGGQGVPSCPAAAESSALRRCCGSLYACGDVVSGCIRARDGVNARLEQRSAGQSELVMDSNRRDACTCAACRRLHCTSAP